jgi:hypothetical protein
MKQADTHASSPSQIKNVPQEVPSALPVHPDVLVPGLHTSHALLGFAAPAMK